MKNILIFLFLLLFYSCGKKYPEIDSDKLSGYWEIQKVHFPDGNEKDFDVNLTVDHIELKGETGSRVKVNPNLDGTFTTNGVAEEFVLKFENDSLRMHYKTAFDEWTETVLEADDEMLKVKNENQVIYSYKKFQNKNLFEN